MVEFYVDLKNRYHNFNGPALVFRGSSNDIAGHYYIHGNLMLKVKSNFIENKFIKINIYDYNIFVNKYYCDFWVKIFNKILSYARINKLRVLILCDFSDYQISNINLDLNFKLAKILSKCCFLRLNPQDEDEDGDEDEDEDED